MKKSLIKIKSKNGNFVTQMSTICQTLPEDQLLNSYLYSTWSFLQSHFFFVPPSFTVDDHLSWCNNSRKSSNKQNQDNQAYDQVLVLTIITIRRSGPKEKMFEPRF